MTVWPSAPRPNRQGTAVSAAGKGQVRLWQWHGIELSTENQRSLGKACAIFGKTGHSQRPKLSWS